MTLPAWAETHALLVGVGEVAALPKRLWLRGPANDVALMRQVLLQRGVPAERVTVLADAGVTDLAAGAQVDAAAGVGRPTGAAIRAAMGRILASAVRGDHVLLHLAGHGLQVPQSPAPRWPEPDGLDEVFLTADVERWSAETGTLPNALRDDEVGDWMDGLVDRGASVALVVDACHAAGFSRDRSERTRVRSVAGAELGVPVVLAAATATAAPARTAAADGPRRAIERRLDGRTLILAARAHEAATEEWLPRGAGLRQARMHGVFSHAVAEELRSGITDAGALVGRVVERYRQEGRAAPTPQVMGRGSPAARRSRR